MAITQLTSYTAKSVGTTTATVFTATAGVQTVINGLTVANTTNVATSASVLITRGGQDVFVVKEATVYPGGSMVCAGWDQKITLIAGDQLRAVSSRAASVDVFASAVLSGEAAAGSEPVIRAANVSPNVLTNVNPNTLVTFTAVDLPASGTLFWTIEGTSITTADFSGASLSGSVVITSGAGSFGITPTFNSWSKSWRVQVRTGSISGPIVATSPYVSMYNVGITTTGLALHLDAGIAVSYPGSGTVWNDMSGLGNNGTLINSPAYSGINGGALVFNGVNNNIELGSLPNLSPAVNVTQSIWFQSRLTAGGTLIRNRLYGYGMSVSANGSVSCFCYSTAAIQLSASSGAGAVSANTWYNLVMTFKDNVLTFYLNGFQIGTTQTSAVNALYYEAVGGAIGTGFVAIGKDGSGTSGFSEITVAQALIYSRGLSAIEVRDNFYSQRSRFGV